VDIPGIVGSSHNKAKHQKNVHCANLWRGVLARGSNDNTMLGKLYLLMARCKKWLGKKGEQVAMAGEIRCLECNSTRIIKAGQVWSGRTKKQQHKCLDCGRSMVNQKKGVSQ